jgi:putative transposase
MVHLVCKFPINVTVPIEELRAALVEFATHYNETWLVARHGNRTPAQIRAAQSQLDQNAMADLKLAA